MTKPIHVGTYVLGHEQVELYALPDDAGGEFYFLPEPGRLGRIKVGIDYPEWDSVVAILLHETLEYLILRMERAYVSVGCISRGTDDRSFILNHPEFSELCSRAAMLITPALPDLGAIYAEHHRPTKTSKKSKQA
jgi:hypothetical protein